MVFQGSSFLGFIPISIAAVACAAFIGCGNPEEELTGLVGGDCNGKPCYVLPPGGGDKIPVVPPRDLRVGEPDLAARKDLKLSYLGNTPSLVDSSGRKTTIDLQKLKSIYSDLHMNSFGMAWKKKADDIGLFKDKFEDQVLRNVKGDSRYQFSPWGDMGRPTTGALCFVTDDYKKAGKSRAPATGKYCHCVATKKSKLLGQEIPGSEGIKYCATQWSGADTRMDEFDIFYASVPAYRAELRRRAVEDMKLVSTWMKDYPENVGIPTIDDFLQGRNTQTMVDRDWFKSAGAEAQKINPKFSVKAVIYCQSLPPEDLNDMKLRHSNYMSQPELNAIPWSSPTWEVELMKKYLSDPNAKKYISGIELFHMGRPNYQAKIGAWSELHYQQTDACLKALKPTGLPVTMGVYWNTYEGLSTYASSTENFFKAAKLLSGNSNIVGFNFFQTPIDPVTSSLDQPIAQMIERVFNFPN